MVVFGGPSLYKDNNLVRLFATPAAEGLFRDRLDIDDELLEDAFMAQVSYVRMCRSR